MSLQSNSELLIFSTLSVVKEMITDMIMITGTLGIAIDEKIRMLMVIVNEFKDKNYKIICQSELSLKKIKFKKIKFIYFDVEKTNY